MKGSLLILMLLTEIACGVGPLNPTCCMTLYPTTCYRSLGSVPIVDLMSKLYSSIFLYKISVEVSLDEVTRSVE